MADPKPTRLKSEQQAAYRERGYHFPLRAFAESEAASLRQRFDAYWEQNKLQLESKLPRERVVILIETHLFLRWVYEMASHPRVLDAVESVLGPDVMLWNTHWFPKFPHDKAYVSWHQDATYWGLNPPNVTTAWIALTESTPQMGCMRVMPATHKTLNLPQRETYAVDNMLSRGQEIAVEVDEAQSVDIALQPGEFSLHHVGIVHGSGPNQSDHARIGLAARYISPNVVQQGTERDIVLLVRGKDEYGHFDVASPPDHDLAYAESPIHAEALNRKTRNLMPKLEVGRT